MKKFIGIVMVVLVVFAFSACDSLKEQRIEAKEALETYATQKGEDNYTQANWEAIEEIVESGKKKIDKAEDKAAIDDAVAAAKAEIDEIEKIAEDEPSLDEYKTQAKAGLDAYATEADYIQGNWGEIQDIISAAKDDIDQAEDEAGVDTVVAAAKAEIDEIEKIEGPAA